MEANLNCVIMIFVFFCDEMLASWCEAGQILGRINMLAADNLVGTKFVALKTKLYYVNTISIQTAQAGRFHLISPC